MLKTPNNNLKPLSRIFSIISKIKIKSRWRFMIVFLIATCTTVYITNIHNIVAASPSNNIAKTENLINQPQNIANTGDDLLNQGKEAYLNGEFPQGVKFLQQAISAFKTEKNTLGEALSLSNLSLTWQQLGQWTEAKNSLEESVKLINQIGANSNVVRIKAQILNTQGSLEFTQGQPEMAEITWEKSGKLYQQVKDDNGYNRTLINRSSALQSMGLYRRALELLETVKNNLQTSTDTQLKAASLRSLGNAYRLVGDLENSKLILEESLKQAQQFGAAQDIADTLLSLGNTVRAQQDTQTASDYYEQAAQISPVVATSLKARVNRLSLLVEIRKDARALEQWQQIKPLLNNINPSRASIESRINIAQSLLKIVDHQTKNPENTEQLNLPTATEIATILALGVEQAKSIGDLRSQSYALGQLGAIYEQNQQIKEAKKLTQEALLIAQSINAPEISYRWQWQLGRIQKALGEKSAAIASYSQAVKTLQSLRNDLVAISSEVQFSFRESVEPIYRQLVGLLLEKDNQGQESSQENLLKARGVIESLQLAELDNFFQEACLQAKPVQVDKIDPSAALIYPIILEDRLEVIVSVAQQPIIHYSTNLPRGDIEDIVNRYKQSLTPLGSNRDRFQIAKQMYDWLISPAESNLKANNIKTLVFVLDGSLRSLPMATLHDGKEYLVQKYAIALSPGLQLLEPRALSKIKLQVLKAGLSESRQGFAPLPAVQTELEEIGKEVPGKILLNEQLTSSNVQTEISAAPFPVIHLATHGQFSSKAKDTFILTWDGKINVKELDQILKSRNVGENNTLELLVLSACQTASGDNRATLGLAGVAVRSGARSTIASLWSVKDEATAALMVKFYKLLSDGKMTKAEALRQAQVSLLEQPQFKHPLYWAPFVLIGNWL
jgi:CHAT domain-containing protein